MCLHFETRSGATASGISARMHEAVVSTSPGLKSTYAGLERLDPPVGIFFRETDANPVLFLRGDKDGCTGHTR